MKPTIITLGRIEGYPDLTEPRIGALLQTYAAKGIPVEELLKRTDRYGTTMGSITRLVYLKLLTLEDGKVNITEAGKVAARACIAAMRPAS